MKCNQFVIKNSEGQFIKYNTGDQQFTNTLYDAEVYNSKDYCERLIDYLCEYKQIYDLMVADYCLQ